MNDQPAFELEPDELWEVGTLGPVIERIRPSRDHLMSGAIVGFGFLSLGLVGLLLALLNHRTEGWITLAIAVGFFPVMGVAILIDVARIATLNIYLCEKGFYCDNFRSRKVFAWESIRSIREKVVYFYTTKDDLRERKYRWLTCEFIITNDADQRIRLGSWLGRGAKGLEDAMIASATQYEIPWELKESHRADPNSWND